jgi:GNAT superfamily N-acetyltransferase
MTRSDILPHILPNILGDATPEQLERAAALNHTELFGLDAVALGGVVRQGDGLTWTYAGTNVESIIPFPALEEDKASAQLDQLIADYLLHPPKGAGCWSLDPPQPKDLGVRLLARGFQPGWRPCWMVLDLEKMLPPYPTPKGLQVTADNLTPLQDIEHLPYARAIIPPRPSPGQPPNGRSSPDQTFPGQLSSDAQPDQPAGLQRFVATLNKKVVGHSGVLLTKGAYGVAGIYHVGVVPGARKKGIGKAVVMAACLYARERGYRYAVLNATGRRMYEQLGFKWIGDGWTWWLKMDRLLAQPPVKEAIELAEAIGRGDLEALERLKTSEALKQLEDPGRLKALAHAFDPAVLQKPLTNGMTLMQLAVHCGQPASGEWLLQQGCTYQVLDAWDLGWKDRAARLLQEHPEQANELYTPWNKTLLHVAAERNDPELARLVLSARPQLKIKDKAYQSTALDWARHFGHEEIARLIRSGGK